ncbi:hypothetical protein F4814DRAFT_450907 [Daldinia grandis]|nr:hypothetical protein F4814DRAFT_450907 [Daldinia grandis]
MATTPPSWLDDAFKSAKEDFKESLKNPALYDFSKINSPDNGPLKFILQASSAVISAFDKVVKVIASLGMINRTLEDGMTLQIVPYNVYGSTVFLVLTFLVGNLIKKMQDSDRRALFAFLSHDDQAAGDTVNVLHSLIF